MLFCLVSEEHFMLSDTKQKKPDKCFWKKYSEKYKKYLLFLNRQCIITYVFEIWYALLAQLVEQ